MKRDMRKAIDSYTTTFTSKNKEKFYGTDIPQLFSLSETNGHVDTWKLTANALRAGFMIGYQAALREMRKKAKK